MNFNCIGWFKIKVATRIVLVPSQLLNFPQILDKFLQKKDLSQWRSA